MKYALTIQLLTDDSYQWPASVHLIEYVKQVAIVDDCSYDHHEGIGKAIFVSRFDFTIDHDIERASVERLIEKIHDKTDLLYPWTDRTTRCDSVAYTNGPYLTAVRCVRGKDPRQVSWRNDVWKRSMYGYHRVTGPAEYDLTSNFVERRYHLLNVQVPSFEKVTNEESVCQYLAEHPEHLWVIKELIAEGALTVDEQFVLALETAEL